MLLSFGALVWLTYPLGAELFSPWVGHRGGARRAHAPGDGARRAARLPGRAVRDARGRRGAARGAAAAPRRRRCWPCSRSPACCARRPGCSAACTGSTVAGADAARRAPDVRALVAAAPVDLGGQRLDRHRRRAALAARHGRPRRGQADRRRSPEDVPYWTAQYFGYALREPLVIGVPIGPRRSRGCYARRARDAAARGRRRDDRRVRDRPAVRAAADPPLHRDAGDPAGAVLRAGGRAAGRCCRAGRERRRWTCAGAFAVAALGRLPARGTSACSTSVDRRVDATGPMYADLRRSAEAPAVRAAFAALRAALDRATTARSRTCATGSTARPGRSARSRGDASPLGPGAAAAAPTTARRGALPQERSRRSRAAAPAGHRTLYARTAPGGSTPRPAARAVLDVLHRRSRRP